MKFAVALRLATLLPALLASSSAIAQSYPKDTVTLVSSAPAGGSIDFVARLVANGLGTALGKPVIVEARPGAGGNIAAAHVAKAPADGHTLLIMASSTVTVNPHIYKSLPFDPEKSFAPIISPAGMNLILVVHPKLGVSTLREFIDLVRAKPGKLNYASGGIGNFQHLAGEVFGTETGTRSNHVPYKGAAPALNDLLSGQTDYLFDSATSIPHVKAGKLRALAVLGPNRVAALPDVATFRDLGLEGMEAVRGYYAIVAPAGTGDDIVQRLNAEIVKILHQPSSKERIADIGLDPITSTPHELAKMLREDRVRYGKVVRQAKIIAE